MTQSPLIGGWVMTHSQELFLERLSCSHGVVLCPFLFYVMDGSLDFEELLGYKVFDHVANQRKLGALDPARVVDQLLGELPRLG